MNCKILFFIPALVFASACGGGAESGAHQKDTTGTGRDSLHRDITALKESFNEEDIPGSEFLRDTLQAVRANVKRINSITNWTSVDTKDIETGEGAEVKFYYKDEKLEKIVARRLGETFQQLAEYYLLNNKLSFVFEKTYRYNRPIFYDSIAMKENNDTEVFDFKKSTIIESRSYFANDKLIHQVNNGSNDASVTDDYLRKEQDRVEQEFKELILLAKNKTGSAP